MSVAQLADEKQERNRPEGDRPTRAGESADGSCHPSLLDSRPVRKVAARAAGYEIAWSAIPFVDRPPEALPVVERRQAPGKIKAEKPQASRSGFVPGPRSRLRQRRARFWTRRLHGSGCRRRTPTRSIKLS